MATQNYEVTVNPNAITLDLTTQNNILTVQTVDYIMSLSRTGGQGAQGYSAYEIAVQNGYTGTAQEFSDELASIAEKSALAVASATAAANSATSATNSATASAASASNSSISAGAASASANAAAQSAVTAAAQSNNSAQSAINAAASALEASNWADASEDSAIDSELSAADAAASEDAAASSEANALLYRNEAQTAATSAGASSTNANAQALAASLSAASAATSATNADNSEDNAASSATSALNSATSANTSANQAAISATTATTQATSATNSATAAAASQADALVSKNSASASASTATTKASEASNSAATASTKATEASTSAAQAVLSATSASTSASTATLKAAEAAQSAADAAAAQAAAEASLASFRSTYLGELNADPTLDGNGDPVMIGAEYFNSVANKLKVYTSTGWQFYDATAQTASQNAALSASQAASSAATSQSYATTAINKAAEAATSANAADASADAALASENAAESSEINASASENYALNYKNAAATSADLASSYASASGVSATNAATSATTATTQATNSANSATASATSATNSANSALASANSATNAANSAASAATSAANASVSEANANTSEENAFTSAINAETKAAEASTSASNAAVSATNSAASATSSALSEGLATTAAATATTKASEASVSATSASGSAATATTKAAEATSAASSANTSAVNAGTYETNAANSASSANTSSASASTSATLAGNSANAAALSETNAATSASAANTYASNAATSASSADTSESNAEIYADNALASSIAAANTVTTVTGYANTASTKADEASASATSAANSATSATASANTATTQATNASNSATAASTSASNASASATTASTQASNAASSANSASTSASAASISATNAATSATNASDSATAAGSAKIAAEAARDQALAAFDNFDDKYLGEKASNPTLDNDGNTLVVGALYFNTTLQGMRVYTGTAWVAAYMSGDGYLLGSNNLSDLTNVVTARTNLGLGTSALANGYNLDGLTDVTISSVTNGQILEYESATSTWKNKTINALPTQATHNGQFLTTDGTNASWATVDALPPQATHADKFLRTDGTAAYWATVNLPTSAYTRTSFTATAGQTTFNVTYPLGSIQVYVNGVLLKTSDYTATNETSFTLTVPASAGAAVDALVYNVYGVGQVLAENIIGIVAIGSGGTGATTAAGARTNLGLGTAATTDSTAYATAAQGALIDNIVSATKEPIGFVNKNDSSISFNSTTRVFTISPVSSSFEVWCKGVKNVVSTAQTITLPNTTALYYIYYSSLGVLSYKTTYFTWDSDTPVSYVYWNATTGQATYFADERHGTTLDWATHEYLHRTRGAVIASGFAANGYTLSGTGDLNSDAQISIESGTFFDEDLEINVVSTATPTQNTWTQNLLFPAKIPVLRLSGASEWILDTATDYPLKQGTARPQYNYYSGGVWLTADVLNNDYTCSWIIATNNLNHPVMAIISQSNLTTLSNAQSAKFEELILTNFPSLEFRPLYKLIFQGNDGYDNTPNARLREIYDLRAVQSAGVSAAAVNDHSNLSGLSDDDHPQYLHVDNIRTVSAAVKASLLPSQTNNANKFLNTNGTETSWSLVDVGNVTGTLPISNGGTGATTATGALTNLGAYPATNPSNYITTAGARSAISVTGAGSYDSNTGVINIVGGVTSFNTRTGAISLTSGDVTGALGFTPYNSTNPNGYISGITSGNVTTALGYSPENVANKGNANGYASLDGSGLVPASQLPSYVDDVLEYANLASFPGAGTTGKIYVALDTNKTYRWSGTAYIYITSGAVDSVAGKTGIVTLNNSDVGLGSVENKSSATIRSEITSSNVTTALGYTPYNATNPSGYITSSALSPYLTSATAASTYLPLAGGTMTSTISYSNTTGTKLSFYNTGTDKYGIDVQNSELRIYSGAQGDALGGITFGKHDNTTFTEWMRIRNNGAVVISGNQVLHAGNYNSYSPTLTGANASGTWGINVTGTSSSISGFNNPTTAPTANTIVYRDSSGDISAREIVLSSALQSAVPTVLVGMFPTTNQLVRMTPAAVASAIQTGASGTWGINISGSANTASNSNTVGGLAPVNFFNNMGQTHEARTSFDASSPSYDHGFRYVQGSANGPGTGGNQFYSWYIGLGSQYPGTGTGSYGAMFAVDRDRAIPYLSLRYNEGNSFSTWRKVAAGYADTSGYATTAGSATDSSKLPLSGGTLTGNTQLYANDGGNSPRLIFGPEAGQPFSHKAIYTDAYWLTFQGHANEGMRFRLGNGSALTTYGTLTSSYLDHGSSLRAPIFYDLNNTAFYVDPAAVGPSAALASSIYVGGQSADGVLWDYGSGNEYRPGIQIRGNYPHIDMVGTAANGSHGPTLRFMGYDSGASGAYKHWVIGSASNNLTFLDIGFSSNESNPHGGIDGYSGTTIFRATTSGNVGLGGDWGSNGSNGNPSFPLHVIGTGYATNDFRAPIFYDSNDTGSYIDPNNMSSMFGVAIRGDNSSTGTSNQLFLWGAGNTTTSAIGFKANGGYFPNPTGQGDGYNTYFTMDSNGRGWVFRQGQGGSDFGAVTTSGWITNNGTWQSNGSMRAPIFYDSNNTAYYTDPASTSKLNVLEVGTGPGGNNAGNLYIVGNNRWRWIAGYAPDYGVGDGFGLYNDTQGAYYSSVTTGGNWWFGSNNHSSSYRVSINGTGYATGDFRAPMFYDSDDTGRYLNPANTSNLGTVKANVFCGNDGNAYGIYKGYDNANHFIGIRCVVGGNTTNPTFTGQHSTTLVEYAEANDTTGWFFRTSATGNYDVISRITRSYSHFNSSVRSPLFYDSDDTGYYIDPNSTSDSALRMRGGALFGPNVTWGASLYVGGNGRVGTNASVAVTNGNLHIDSQDGYNLYLNWYNTASIFTQSNLGVGSSSASYRLHVHGTGYATSDFRAPIFYDSNDTGYFCDPNGRSNFSQANFPNGLQFSGSFCLVNSGATLDNSTGMRMTESYGAVWNGSNGATWHHQVVNASSLCGFNASGGNFGNGNILASGNITAYYSDERLKTKLTTIENALDKVRSLEGFIYVENDLAKSLGYTNSGEQAGVSAQRVKAVLPQAVSLAPVDMQGVPETGEIVSKSGENYLTVDYSRIVPLLIEAIKEQDTEVTTLRSQLQQQQSELDELKSLVKSLLANR